MTTYRSLSLLPLLTKHKFVDAWFPVSYSINFKNGCPFNCVYCPVNFQKQKVIVNKKNIFNNLAKECRHIPYRSFIGIGGGYGETFFQAKNEETHNLIKLLLNHKHKLLFLTQTSHFKNYISLFSDLENKPILTITFNCFDEKTNALLSPNTSTLAEKIALIRLCKKNNIPVGILFSPIIIGINDGQQHIEGVMKICQEEKVNFFLFDFANQESLPYIRQKILSLKEAKRVIGKNFSFIEKYFEDKYLYQSYMNGVVKNILYELKSKKVMPRIPLYLLHERLASKELVTVLLFQIYSFLKWNGVVKKSFHFYAYKINQMSDKDFQQSVKEQDFQQRMNISLSFQKMIFQMIDGNFSNYLKIVAEFFSKK